MQLLSLVQNNSSFKQTALDPGRGPGGVASLIFGPNRGPKGRKNLGGRPPPLSKGLDDRPPPPLPLISRSGSGPGE